MITELYDRVSGVTRHEIGTVNASACRKAICEAGGELVRTDENGVHIYSAKFKGVLIDIVSTPTRTILFCKNRYALPEYEKELSLSEWAYDNSNQFDYMPMRR